MSNEFKIGEKVKCKKFGALNHDFTGNIEKIYENSALVSIQEHEKEDEVAVNDFHKRVIVRLTNMKKIS
ncbi:MAG: DUF2187 domain-containing protein [Liquorilactobacillus nagelii]|jgi:hypothetical protein|uniref:DUF2187 domain-containing protein n=1 Tax=Liquorilactobacillus nagelii TaxID=82688 RepID=A0A3S6QWJ3_9LACO|nr:DUF2187 domain-containing protein [Liquorilactobacillus nagelii]AUJ32443.1 DUF2187 domain-containing protein [Liquorilactobacillus nagelii]MCC7615631.1 DUF2187 domain-containing protein [Liquorilactobacillus nagelii]MCI1634373.1 DUF2187 domain-containing protein [Liquorilactobacillus nagelii]MCI1699262.1 DUF2187 domain-containing protein [Liquorilactobacillus nagelii]MCI1922224.1 DUF2187 domain-containing protein [Liquorilactobacillus nagelii]